MWTTSVEEIVVLQVLNILYLFMLQRMKNTLFPLTRQTYFLAQGYAVVFLSRKNSLQPFSRYFQLRHPNGDFIDFLSIEDSKINVSGEYLSSVFSIVSAYQQVKTSGKLLKISFVSIFDYLFLLRSAVKILSEAKERFVLFAAAAVADFYIPPREMAEHKIQSSQLPEGLTLCLRPVPKMLSIIVSDWAPHSFIVSFKLETDEGILEKKAKNAIKNAGQQLVIANILASYKDRVKLFGKDGVELEIVRKPTSTDIEADLIKVVIEQHSLWIDKL